MSEIKISKKEVKVVKKEIDFLKEKVCDVLNLESYKWLSDPNVYKDLINSLLENNGIENSDVKVPATFLRNFFYYQDDSKQVRATSIDSLYQCLFGMTREEYLTKEKKIFSSKKAYGLASTLTRDVSDIFNEQLGTKDIDTIRLSDATLYSLLEKANDKNSIIHLHIDEYFLKDIKGVNFLIELFGNRFIPLIVDYNVHFHIDKDLMKAEDKDDHINLVTIEGIHAICKYWKKKNKDGLLQYRYDSDFINKLTGDTLYFILDNLIKYRVVKSTNQARYEQSRKNMNVQDSLPILKEINQIKPDLLNEIYLDSTRLKENNISEYNFFCVVRYDSYYKQDEKLEMLRYMFKFSENLYEANKIRIFTLPSKRIKKIGWTSNLKTEANELLYRYVYANITTGVRTFCLFYDEDEVSNDNHIIWNQDYVIKNRKIENQNDDQLVDFLINGNNPLVEEVNDGKLYFAYPETADHKNQCLKINDRSYTIRMLKDFLNRFSYSDKSHELMSFDKNNIETLHNKLKFNSAELVKSLEDEVNYLKSVLYTPPPLVNA